MAYVVRYPLTSVIWYRRVRSMRSQYSHSTLGTQILCTQLIEIVCAVTHMHARTQDGIRWSDRYIQANIAPFAIDPRPNKDSVKLGAWVGLSLHLDVHHKRNRHPSNIPLLSLMYKGNQPRSFYLWFWFDSFHLKPFHRLLISKFSTRKWSEMMVLLHMTTLYCPHREISWMHLTRLLCRVSIISTVPLKGGRSFS